MSVSAPGEQTAVGQRPGGTVFHGYDEEAEEYLQTVGGMPLCLRIAVTGHRDIRDPGRARQEAADAIRWITDELHLAEVSEHSPVWLQVLTPLAAGADQIAAEAMQSLGIAGTTLTVPVPADEASYEESIRRDDPAAADRYRRLRRHAIVTKLPGTTADDAGFRRLGEWVVDHCDALLALWDGQPPPPADPTGAPPGTAGIVSYALSHPREIPVIVVPVARREPGGGPSGGPSGGPGPDLPPGQLLLRVEHANPFLGPLAVRGSEPAGLSPRLPDRQDRDSAAQQEREADFERSVRSWPLNAEGGRVLRRNVLGVTIRHIERLNARPHRTTEKGFSAQVDRALDTSAGPIPEAARRVEAWAYARYLRADSLAGRYQSLSRLLDRSVYWLAALSVLLVAIRTIWAVPGSAFALVLNALDFLILLTVSAIVIGDLRGRLRDRWVCFRAMAEYLRTYMFLALINLRRRTPASEEHPSLTSLGLNEYVGPAWFDRSMKAIWRHRPELQPPWSDADLPALKRVLCGWILDQEQYHYSTAADHAAKHRRFLVIVASLFIITVLAAATHFFFPTEKRVDNVLNFIAIGVPGVAAAFNSIAAAGEHHRHSVRSRAVMHRLSYQYLPAIMEAASLRELRRQADALGHYILGESTDWYEVMAVHSVDIPT